MSTGAAQFAEIVLVNFVLSGDNALVIAMATLRLPPAQQRGAMVFGTALSVALRIALTLAAGRMLQLPFLQAAGGLLLVYLAMSLVLGQSADREMAGGKMAGARRSPPGRMAGAVVSIALADAAMSVDNILALAGISAGNETLLAAGLLVSVSLIMFASAAVSAVLIRYPLLVYLGAGVLAWTAGGMIGRDPAVSPFFSSYPQAPLAVVAAAVLGSYGLIRVFRWNG